MKARILVQPALGFVLGFAFAGAPAAAQPELEVSPIVVATSDGARFDVNEGARVYRIARVLDDGEAPDGVDACAIEVLALRTPASPGRSLQMQVVFHGARGAPQLLAAYVADRPGADAPWSDAVLCDGALTPFDDGSVDGCGRGMLNDLSLSVAPLSSDVDGRVAFAIEGDVVLEATAADQPPVARRFGLRAEGFAIFQDDAPDARARWDACAAASVS